MPNESILSEAIPELPEAAAPATVDCVLCSNSFIFFAKVKGADGQGLLGCYSEWKATGGLNLMLAMPNTWHTHH